MEHWLQLQREEHIKIQTRMYWMGPKHRAESQHWENHFLLCISSLCIKDYSWHQFPSPCVLLILLHGVHLNASHV